MSRKVLVAEDDEQVRRYVERALRLEGYVVATAGDGEEARRAVEAERPDVVVLDIMMPRLDGISVCRLMRAPGDRTPVLMLTARHELSDRVAGLDAGADDYLVKPFALEELLARVRALVRRRYSARGSVLTIGDLELDTVGRSVRRAGKPITLSAREYAVLEYLALRREIGRASGRERV
jgi:two-component system response regulator MprA